MATTPHALVFPLPVQSHILAHLELSYCLIDRGFKVTFLNTELNHTRLLSTLSTEQEASATTLKTVDGIRLATIPDGLGPEEDRGDLELYTKIIMFAMPRHFEEFMARQVDESIEERFTCLIADEFMAWAIDVAKEAGLRSAAFCTASAAVLAQTLSIPKFIEDGVIDDDGVPKQQGMLQMNQEMTPLDTTYLFWNCFKDSKLRKITFISTANTNKPIKNADLILCNTIYELEKPIFTYAPNILPIGPLLIGSRPGKTFGNFWVQDTKTMEWLDQHKKNSVIYVAFGSFTIFNKHQMEELALGLELLGRPFLWVVRPDFTNNDNDSLINLSALIEKVGDRGRIVDWCPQLKVLAHPSVACFMSHCGWNSVLEGVTNGVPFLCWPYFADQFINQSYVCDTWRVGLRIMDDEEMICPKEQIVIKLEELTGDMGFRERSLALMKMVRESPVTGGSSYANFNIFINMMMGA